MNKTNKFYFENNYCERCPSLIFSQCVNSMICEQSQSTNSEGENLIIINQEGESLVELASHLNLDNPMRRLLEWCPHRSKLKLLAKLKSV